MYSQEPITLISAGFPLFKSRVHLVKLIYLRKRKVSMRTVKISVSPTIEL